MDKNFDFSGWATKANLLCSDGRTIMKNAFSHQDGDTVPIVWMHNHDEPEKVLGHAVLENRDEGVYAYGKFNDTESGQNAKILVQNGDVTNLSIYANKLRHQGSNVVHGMIRELSLVLAGANPGAKIDTVLMHSDDSCEEGYIYTDELIESTNSLEHAENNAKGEPEMAEETNKKNGEKTIGEALNELTEDQKVLVYSIIGQILKDAGIDIDTDPDEEVQHSDYDDEDEDEDDDESLEDVFDTLNEKQKEAVYELVGRLIEENEESQGGDEAMKHNVFEEEVEMDNFLSHDDMKIILDNAKRQGSLRDAVLDYVNNSDTLAHGDAEYGIADIDFLFPDAKTITDTPDFIKRDDSWVTDLMTGIHHTPFSRIKSVFADITEAEARAKGYVKGNLKMEEVFTLLKRITTPTTVYKKQKLDKDDTKDIVDFDVIAWIKREMRMMLDEEIARAILVGDGRSASHNDKINEQNVRPIWTDDDLFTVKQAITVASNATSDDKARAFIRATIKSRKFYKGSGNPIMFMSEDMLTDCLLLEDKNQRVIYDSIEKLATALRVKKIVTVPVMEGLTRTVDTNTHELAGIYVNPKDYSVGADKGGSIDMFEDFDIDYNQMKYLIETRISGAMNKPYGAVALEFVTSAA